MSRTNKKLKYPWGWSVDICLPFLERYRRGTGIVADMLDLPVDKVESLVIQRLAEGNSIRFQAIKKVIKEAEDYDQGELKRIQTADTKLLFKRLLWIAEGEVLEEKHRQLDLDIPEI